MADEEAFLLDGLLAVGTKSVASGLNDIVDRVRDSDPGRESRLQNLLLLPISEAGPIGNVAAE